MSYNIKKIKTETVNSLSDVITEVILDYCIEENGKTACAYCRIDLNTPDADNFVAYANVTKDMVVSWLQAKINFADFDEALRLQLQKQATTIDNPF